MSAHSPLPEAGAARLLPLLRAGNPDRVLLWRCGRPVSAAAFLARVRRVAAELPALPAVVNLCTDRYAFLVAWGAALLRGQVTLLPPSRAPEAVDEVMAMHPGCYALGECPPAAPPRGYRQLPDLERGLPRTDGLPWPELPAEQLAAVAYTSGSTGAPRASRKTWGSLCASNAGNLRMLGGVVEGPFHIVATVPPQHMYGMETSVLLPLGGGHAVHAGCPFFPADVVAALEEIPGPRVLVTTPVHLRALVESGLALPPLAAMLSATAPLPLELGRAAEARFHAPLHEVFGSTETCVFASRRATLDEEWTLYPGVAVQAQPDGTRVDAPQLAEPVVLADIVRVSPSGTGFWLSGRHADLLEIAGKRASLGDLTRRLLAVPGVRDGVVFQLDAGDALGVRRIAALAVAPGLDEAQVQDALRAAVDPAFLPRPLRLVRALPRNELGKLPRAALLAALARGHDA